MIKSINLLLLQFFLAFPSACGLASIKKSRATQWIACSSTKEVNRAIEKFVREGDTVAELGSQLRESSTALCDAIGPHGKALLVDIERKFPKGKQQKRTLAMRLEGDEENFYTDRVKFVTTKSFDFWRNALFFQGFLDQHDGKDDKLKSNQNFYDALVVDFSTVAGNDLDLTCISLVREFLALNSGDGEAVHNPCRIVIVKSGSLHALARKLFHAQRIFAGIESLSDNPGRTSIIGTVGVEEYRQTIPYCVKEGDAVLEVGSHFGTTTTLLHDAAKGPSQEGNSFNGGGCIGVDVGPSIIEAAKKKFPHVPFVVGDAWKTADLARMKPRYLSNHHSSSSNHYDVVYVDVGGLSGSEGLLEAVSLLSAIENSLEPRCIIIKSLCMRRLASSLIPFSKIWRKEKLQEMNR